MSVDDILFAPILPPFVEDLIRDMIRRVMTTPRSSSITNAVSRDIVNILENYGFTDENEIADIVRRLIKECDGSDAV